MLEDRGLLSQSLACREHSEELTRARSCRTQETVPGACRPQRTEVKNISSPVIPGADDGGDFRSCRNGDLGRTDAPQG